VARKSGNAKLRVGVIGGRFGRNHILAFGKTGNVEVTAFCQRTRPEELAREFHIPHVFSDYRELLALEGLDAISLAVPTYLHHPITMEALSRGLHVLCEKPLALNKEEAGAMLARAEEAGLVHMTAFNFRFIPAIQRMKELLEEGYVGRPLHADLVWFSEGRADPGRPLVWRNRKELAGVGVLGDTGVHLVDLARWLVGDFTRVCGHAATFTKEWPLPDGSGIGGVAVEDSCLFVAELVGGVQASIHASGVARGGTVQSIGIFGSDGMLRVEIDRKTPAWLVGELWGAQGSNSVRELLPIPERLTQGLNLSDPSRAPGEFLFSHLTRRFAQSIQTGEPAGPSFRDGLAAQKVIDAVTKSAEQGSWVTVA